MKNLKISAVAMAVAGALGASTASAYTLGTFDDGLLIPQASHAGSTTDTTVVGLMSSNTSGCYDASGNMKVYWTFFNVNSGHVTDGDFTMTQNDMYSFIWASESGTGLDGTDGYLVFAAGDIVSSGNLTGADGNDCVAGNAFYLDVPNNDVAYVPAVPLDGADFETDGVTTMDAGSVSSLTAGGASGATVDMRYFIDGSSGGDDTDIVLWTTEDMRTGSGGCMSHSVDMYDDSENRKSVNFELCNAELNIVDPEDIVGRPSDFTDGFVFWDGVPSPFFSYSIVESPTFGAKQTLLNPTQ